MAVSDRVEELSRQAKSFEDAVDAFNNEAREQIESRRAEAKRSLEDARDRAGAQMQADADEFKADWAALQASVAQSFDDLNANLAEKREKHAAKRAGHRADVAEEDAELAIDFAIYALQEAEYAVLDAAYYRDQANRFATS
jgi:hypothetical protein